MATAFDAGINFLDTSDSYSQGGSERVIGNFFRSTSWRDQIVLATKYRSQVGRWSERHRSVAVSHREDGRSLAQSA